MGTAFSGKTLLFADSGAIVYPVDDSQRGNRDGVYRVDDIWTANRQEYIGNNGVADCSEKPRSAGIGIGGCDYVVTRIPAIPIDRATKSCNMVHDQMTEDAAQPWVVPADAIDFIVYRVNACRDKWVSPGC